MTPIDRARRTLVEAHGFQPERAATAVQAVLHEIANADEEMRTAGAAELSRALAAGTSRAYARDLAMTVWKAMLFRADR